MQEQRHVREQALRQHVARIAGVDLAVDGERRRSGEPADRDGTGRSLAVVEELSGSQRRRQIRRAERRGVLIGAAREQQLIPRRQREAEHEHAERGDRPERSPAAGHTSGPDNHQRPKGGDDGDRADGAVQPDPGDQHEAGEQRAGNRAGGVHGIDQSRDPR